MCNARRVYEASLQCFSPTREWCAFMWPLKPSDRPLEAWITGSSGCLQMPFRWPQPYLNEMRFCPFPEQKGRYKVLNYATAECRYPLPPQIIMLKSTPPRQWYQKRGLGRRGWAVRTNLLYGADWAETPRFFLPVRLVFTDSHLWGTPDLMESWSWLFGLQNLARKVCCSQTTQAWMKGDSQ